jgi:hypothetical protein
MFFSLLIVTFLISVAVCTIIALIFARPVNRIMHRIIPEDISAAWVKYMLFAIYVVGISGGVRVYQLERYITAPGKDEVVLTLTRDRWIIEVYRTVIESLSSMAWMLLVFFVFALIAFVVVRGLELKHRDTTPFHRVDDPGRTV